MTVVGDGRGVPVIERGGMGVRGAGGEYHEVQLGKRHRYEPGELR